MYPSSFPQFNRNRLLVSHIKNACLPGTKKEGRNWVDISRTGAVDAAASEVVKKLFRIFWIS